MNANQIITEFESDENYGLGTIAIVKAMSFVITFFIV